MANKTIQPNSAAAHSPLMIKGVRYVADFVHFVVLVLSLALIVWISYDTFKDVAFLQNKAYMNFQFWVCVVFLADFFWELYLAPSKGRYLATRWLFFIISIPYLNIINHFNIQLPSNVIYYLRFIPLVRGAYSLALVIGYISNNRAVSLLWQYATILIAMVYILGLLFFYEEHGVNTNVKTFWDALYFSAMNTTTVGCYFAAVTPVGKIISVICPTLGMLMLPIFTVYVTSWIQRYDARRKALLGISDNSDGDGDSDSNSSDQQVAEPAQ